MEKITRREFIDTLRNNASVLMGAPCVAANNDNKIVMCMENTVGINAKAERRVVTEKHATYLLFSNGSRMAFDQEGRFDYFKHTNENGYTFVLQRQAWFDEFDEVWMRKYVVYAVIAADVNDAERQYKGVEVWHGAEKFAAVKWLRVNGYRFETSDAGDTCHIEVLCSDREAEIINKALGKIREDIIVLSDMGVA